MPDAAVVLMTYPCCGTRRNRNQSQLCEVFVLATLVAATVVRETQGSGSAKFPTFLCYTRPACFGIHNKTDTRAACTTKGQKKSLSRKAGRAKKETRWRARAPSGSNVELIKLSGVCRPRAARLYVEGRDYTTHPSRQRGSRAFLLSTRGNGDISGSPLAGSARTARAR